MAQSFYSPVMKDKLNPEFIGIAHKLSSSKQKRQLIEQKRNSILRSLKFKMNLDVGLEKNLEEQQARLKEVQSVHQRRMANQEFKRWQDEKKKKRLRNMSTSVKERRENLKHNIKDSLHSVLNRNRNLREQEKELSSISQSKIKEDGELKMFHNRIKYKQVKSMEKHCQNMVNQFFRTLNKQSLNSYKNWITEQNEKVEHYTDQIKKMESVILKVETQIEKKKNKIINIFSEIESYTSEPLDVQTRCLPSCLRSNLSQSSHLSKPKDLLLKGTKELFEKC